MDNLISIVIPVYNTGEYLKECLDSVCNQTYDNIEIIVINDGSTDNSLEILRQYEEFDKRIILIDQENKGLSEARNIGVKHSKGSYILFLDSDDYIELTTCEEAIKAALCSDSDVILWPYCREYGGESKPVYFLGKEKVVYDKSNSNCLYQRMVGLVGDQLKNPQMTDSMITAWGKLYKKELLQNVYFVDTKLIGTEDALFNIEVFSKVKKAVYIPKTFSHYRKTNNISLTHVYRKNLALQWKELYRRIYAILNKTNATPIMYTALNNRICLGLIGLGLSIVDDRTMSGKKKKEEIKHILQMKHYQLAIGEFSLQYMPVHWKSFFFFVKKKRVGAVYTLLNIMNYLRNR